MRTEYLYSAKLHVVSEIPAEGQECEAFGARCPHETAGHRESSPARKASANATKPRLLSEITVTQFG